MVKFNGIYEALSVAHQHDIKRDRDGNILEESDRDVAVHASLRFFSDNRDRDYVSLLKTTSLSPCFVPECKLISTSIIGYKSHNLMMQ